MKIVIPNEEPISWNELYSGKHWTFRKREADRVHMLVRAHLDPTLPTFNEPVDISIVSYRKSKRRFDPDNVCTKFYIDGLVPFVIEDDSYLHVNSVKAAVRVDKGNPRLEIEVTPVWDATAERILEEQHPTWERMAQHD